MNSNTAYISIGTNVGDKSENINVALKKIKNIKYTKVVNVSPIYLTEPVGYKNQEYFYNCGVKLKTGISAQELLKQLLDIENEMGRVRTFKNAPRIIDLDLLYYQGCAVKSEFLTLPHPRMFEREFITVILTPIIDDEFEYKDKLVQTHNEYIKFEKNF